MDNIEKLRLCRQIGRLEGANDQIRFLLKNRTAHDDIAWAQLRSTVTDIVNELVKQL